MSKRSKFAWNPKAHQPHNVMTKWERNLQALLDIRSHAKLAAIVALKTPAIIAQYRELELVQPLNHYPIPEIFAVSTEVWGEQQAQVRASLLDLGVTSSLVRIPAWINNQELQTIYRFVLELEAQGIDVVVALLQDRASVLDPQAWQGYLERVLNLFSDRPRYYELGHAWNRKKWGTWHFEEYTRLAKIALTLRTEFPQATFVGPAVLDFEFHFAVGALHELQALAPFAKLSSLLYVDRRGGPENSQYGFDLVRKLRLLKAIATEFSSPAIPLWITEMNWPLKTPGEYSPVTVKQGYSEEQCANFLVRYYLLALSTGYCDRVYWWQLAAHGYGLIDNLDNRWRIRPAYSALKHLIRRLRNATFLGLSVDDDLYSFKFSDAQAHTWQILWSPNSSIPTYLEDVALLLDRDGREIPVTRSIAVSPSPLYAQLSN